MKVYPQLQWTLVFWSFWDDEMIAKDNSSVEWTSLNLQDKLCVLQMWKLEK